MRIITLLPFVIALTPIASRAAATPAPAEKSPATKTLSPEALAKLVAAYPLKTCVISGEKLEDGGDMGDVVNHLHKEPGKPVRLVRFCCKGCVKDFKKDPAKYLKLIDEATATKPEKK